MKNEGYVDRAVRLVAGVVLGLVAWLVLGLAQGEILGVLAGVVAGILIVTAGIGFYPAYRILGVGTCKLSKPK